MIQFINKYNLLKKVLNVGDIVNSKIIKQISSNKAVADIKGYHVVIKSDIPLIENSSLSFLISGFNEKDKIILLKQFNNNDNYKNVFNKLLSLDNYIKKYLKQSNLPVNASTMEIANYLYLKDNRINNDKLEFILKYLKYYSDIPLLYKLNRFQLSNKKLILLLALFRSMINSNEFDDSKQKNLLKRFVLKKGNNISENLKYLSHNKNLLNDLLKLDKNENLPFVIYPLLVNSDSQMGYIFNMCINDKKYPMKFRVDILKDVIFIKIDFDFNETKISYNFYYFKNESESLMIIDTNSQELKEEISLE